MKNWDERDETGYCNADEDFAEVQRICRSLRIPCRHVNFVKEYWAEVFRLDFTNQSKVFDAFNAVIFTTI